MKTIQHSATRTSKPVEPPNLVSVQLESYKWFLEEGLLELFQNFSPIYDFTGQQFVELLDFTLGEPYAIDEVPYVMYFQQNVALHGAFWHRGFGAVRSHGCVNLAPRDARWLFDWVHPFRPEGWYGVYATDTDPGTIVWVRKSEPRDGAGPVAGSR